MECNSCKRKFKRADHFKKHKEQCVTSLKCEECDFTSQWKYSLTLHGKIINSVLLKLELKIAWTNTLITILRFRVRNCILGK